MVGGVAKLDHVRIAERLLGKPLPLGAKVHHVDGFRANNTQANLVVCPSEAYHQLLHQRQRAFDACGKYDWRKCSICGQYDDPARMYSRRKQAVHRQCRNALDKARYADRPPIANANELKGSK